MGLTITVNGFDSFDIGYIGFMKFRLALAGTYNVKLGEYYRRWIFGSLSYTPEKPLSDEEYQEMLNIAGDLIIFLSHSDSDGIFTPSESRKIYKSIENLKMDFEINPEYHGQGAFNVFDRFKAMFFYSWKNRRRVIFT